MPVNGETKEKFNRQYTFIALNPQIGPGSWRLSTIDEIAAIPDPDPDSALRVVDGKDPINSETKQAGRVELTFDITNLDEKA
jgi:hypothetical protein